MAEGVFAKQQAVKPGQMLAVADRRFDDALALCATGDNARANGAQYLAGIVLDVLLKAQLVREYPAVARKRRHEVLEHERHVWNLIWRSHDLGDMLDQLPAVKAAVRKRGERAGRPYLDWLLAICGAWTVYVRYSPLTTTIAEAKAIARPRPRTEGHPSMTQQEAQALADEIGNRFDAQVETEQVDPGRYRFAVISPRFTGVPQLSRQDEVWAAVDQFLPRAAVLDISLILTYAPNEIEVTSGV